MSIIYITLVRGDNLEEMRQFPNKCIDLIATDTPFNSSRNYFVPYRDEHGQEPDTLIRAFTDTWTWGEAAEDAYNHPNYDLSVPVLQIYEIQDYFRGILPKLPFGERAVL